MSSRTILLEGKAKSVITDPILLTTDNGLSDSRVWNIELVGFVHSFMVAHREIIVLRATCCSRIGLD